MNKILCAAVASLSTFLTCDNLDIFFKITFFLRRLTVWRDLPLIENFELKTSNNNNQKNFLSIIH
jgi:hypothetical protein